jgi:uncharacterized protein
MSQSLEQQATDDGPAGIRWQEWGPAAFAAAAAADRLVLLHLTATWCHWCALMDSGTWADTAIIHRVNREFVAIRVDADRYPHVQDRYIAGGWPTNAFLTPTGEVLWSGTYLEAAQFLTLSDSVTEAWRERREELDREITRRRLALESTRARQPGGGLVRREAADDVYTATLAAYDARNGGFGDAPKFPQADVIELLYATAPTDETALRMADQTLDGMLAGELWDSEGGGFFRYATAADWTAPRREKLLDTNSALLDAYAMGAWLRGRADWRQTATGVVRWAGSGLGRPDGLWAASQQASEAWLTADPAAPAPPAPADPTLHTAANARWIAALAMGGARLGETGWVAQAAEALALLLQRMTSPRGGLFHYAAPGGDAHFDFLLADTLHVIRAALAVAQAAGEAAWIGRARELVRHVEATFGSDDGGFWDRLPTDHDIGALRFRERRFDLNALAARLLLDVSHITGERGCRALAERTLARIGGVAGRHGPDGALFALATAEYFEAPPAVVITLPRGAGAAAGAELRHAAFALRHPLLRVWTVPDGHAAGPVTFTTDGRPVAFLWTRNGRSKALTTAAELADAAAHLNA